MIKHNTWRRRQQRRRRLGYDIDDDDGVNGCGVGLL